jgi:hypothetical protein
MIEPAPSSVKRQGRELIWTPTTGEANTFLPCACRTRLARFLPAQENHHVLFHHRPKRRDNSAGVANRVLAFIPITDYAGKCRGFSAELVIEQWQTGHQNPGGNVFNGVRERRNYCMHSTAEMRFG